MIRWRTSGLATELPTSERRGTTEIRSAVILAGGRSRRFGRRDKALAPIEDEPMIRRVARRVAPVADDLVVNCRADQRPALAEALDGLDPRFAIDPEPDQGPVAGLRTGLKAARGTQAAAVACDMPNADPGLYDRLFEVAGAAAIPLVDGRRQPLHGVYDAARAREACDRLLAADCRRLLAVLDALDPALVAVDAARADPTAVTNVNTPADLRRAVGD